MADDKIKINNDIFNLSEISNQIPNISVEKKNFIPSINSFDDLLFFTDDLDKINKLSNKIEELFKISNSHINTHKINTVDELENIHKVIFNYIYEKEIERGNIEYKRSLESYNENDKTNKLIRQIYW